MTIQHKNIVEADLHECKGASTAVVGKTMVASGSATATFKYGNPRGSIYFSNIGTPATVAAPAAYTIVAPTTTANGEAIEYTEATTARLTYTGADTLDAHVTVNISFSQAAGADRDIYISLYKNGAAVTGTEVPVTTESSKKANISLHFPVANVATNDYFEVYLKNAGGAENVSVYTLQLSATSYRG